MTAGFHYNTNAEIFETARQETDGSTCEIIRHLAKEPFVYEPGTRWRYSLAHDVLAVLVEMISGQRFGEYVKEHIFDPLGMTRSAFLLPDEELDTICEQYRFNKETMMAFLKKH